MVIGLFLITRDYFIEKKNEVYGVVSLEELDSDQLDDIDNIDDSGSESDTDKDSDDSKKSDDSKDSKDDSGSSSSTETSSYIGTIEIPKINLKRGFVSPKSKYNNIEYNVTIIKGFNYPDVKNGNFILAAHSGYGPKAIFKNLYKLNTGDSVYITYKKKEYVYTIDKIYTQKKTGSVAIYRNTGKTTLTLITCTKDSDKLQTIYIAYRK